MPSAAQECYICGHTMNVTRGKKNKYPSSIYFFGKVDGKEYFKCAVCKRKGYTVDTFELGLTYDESKAPAFYIFGWDYIVSHSKIHPISANIFRIHTDSIKGGHTLGTYDGMRTITFVDNIAKAVYLHTGSFDNTLDLFIKKIVSSSFHEYLHFYLTEEFVEEHWDLLELPISGNEEDERMITILCCLISGKYQEEVHEIAVCISVADARLSFMRYEDRQLESIKRDLRVAAYRMEKEK